MMVNEFTAELYATVCAYIIIGLLGMLGNGVLVTVCIFNTRMRHKEYGLPYLLAFSELVFSLGMFAAGVSRAVYILLDYWGAFHPRVVCLLHPHNFFFNFDILIALSNWAIVVDRLIAIVRPLFYYSLTIRYTKYMVGGVIAIGTSVGLTTYIGSFVDALNDTTLIETQCSHSQTVYQPFARLQYSYMGGAGAITVVLILVIVILFKCRSYSSSLPGVRESDRKRTERVTLMLMHTLVFSLVFSCVPSVCIAVLVFGREHLNLSPTRELTIIQVFASMIGVNSINNMLIFVWKNLEVRDAVCRLLRIRSNLQRRYTDTDRKESRSVYTVK